MTLSPQKITPFLTFSSTATTTTTSNPALSAAEYYTTLFPNSSITSVNPMVVTFRLAGQAFSALNGGRDFAAFSPAVSLLITCEDQAEVDHYWAALGSEGGGQDLQCGWVRDRFGLSWQVVPTALSRLMAVREGADREPEGEMERVKRVGKRMAGMRKLVVEELERAAEGVGEDVG